MMDMLLNGFIVLFGLVISVANQEYGESTDSCQMIVKTNAQVERVLHGNGFHRNLETLVYLSSPEDLGSCQIMVKESLSSGAYFDPHQLKLMEEFYGDQGPTSFIPQQVNVETVAHLSPRLNAYFFVLPTLMEDNRWLLNMTFPVHFRYHRALSGNDHNLVMTVKIFHPSVYVMCEGLHPNCLPLLQLIPCPPHGHASCQALPVNTFSTTEEVSADIPIGNIDLLDTVLFITMTLTAAAALLLVAAVNKKKLSH